MTTIIREQEIKRSADLLAALQKAIRDLRREIEALKEQAAATGAQSNSEAARTVRSTRDLVAQCLKAETFLNECTRQQAGIAKGGHALDLERARAEIGCRLDRLRRCSDPGGLPE
jgi:uncharacterized protein YhaN